MFVKKNTANTNKLRNLPFGTPILFLNSDYDPLPSRLNFVVKLPLDKKKSWTLYSRFDISEMYYNASDRDNSLVH